MAFATQLSNVMKMQTKDAVKMVANAAKEAGKKGAKAAQDGACAVKDGTEDAVKGIHTILVKRDEPFLVY